MMRQKGYTLIELMTTLAVAAVLISVAMPGMNSFRLQAKLPVNRHGQRADLGHAPGQEYGGHDQHARHAVCQ
jgi:prepilin-type N-terminal cleavage/methylation domain-containing protein